jgi:hypothetical protein
MLQTSALRRPFGSQTLIYNWLEERADVKNERIQKPLPSQVDSSYLIHSLRFNIHFFYSMIIIFLQHTNLPMVLFEVIHLEQKFVILNVNFPLNPLIIQLKYYF